MEHNENNDPNIENISAEQLKSDNREILLSDTNSGEDTKTQMDGKTNEYEKRNFKDTVEKEIILVGKRIIDVDHFLNALKIISLSENHDPGTECTLQNIIVIDERRSGFASTIKLKCNMCKRYYSIKTNYDAEGVNEQAVLGIMSIGLGYKHLEKIAATLEIPYGSHRTYDKFHNKVCDKIEEKTQEVIDEAIKEEKKIAIESGNIINGIPFITVKCDGFWAKRSYKRNYTSLSGCGVVIGAKTNKVISMGVRNKYCVVCKKHENKGSQPKPHRCFKNWMLSSSAMESDVIVTAFQQSLEQHGVIFKTMIADGDSSCYQKLLERDPYAEYNITVEKIECKNHLLRNYINKLADICKNKHAGPAVLRKKIKVN